MVGCLGSDTVTKNMANLLAKVKATDEAGISAFCYTGGYEVPPRTLTQDIRTDILFIKEIIGVGEVAIADDRSRDPDAHDLARVVSDGRVAGMLSKKAGVTHFHMGDKKQGMKILFKLMEEFDLPSNCIYPTHVGRTESLMKDATKFTIKDGFVNLDTTEGNLHECLTKILGYGAKKDRITVSTDASINSPDSLFAQLRECHLKYKMNLEDVLPHFTSHTANVLKLHSKGGLEVKKDADLVIVERKNFTIRDVIARGKVLMRNGRISTLNPDEVQSRREFQYHGTDRDKIKKMFQS
ncbi:amidohydrolase family protein [Bdellovibrio bacteriovorus]|uniref:amidohydrolase family protein n=1 Tax=Bdellovibrio bacteriovorus TaxID=959 RepID=UPI0035A5B6FA